MRQPETALLDLPLVLGASMRLTRLVVSDDLGQWWIKDPVQAWLHAEPDMNGEPTGIPLESHMRWARYAEGLDCPFCVGQWIAFGVLGSWLMTRRSRLLRPAWRFVAGGLTLNEVAAHLGARLGDTSYTD
jgi:hypothetical protein